MTAIKELKPESVFRFFEEMSQIPHGSGNTKDISDYLVNYAKERNLEYHQDEYHNVVIIKEASAGYEQAPAVILQGHMDMVCQKTAESDHDFLKDPLQLAVEGEFLVAKDTTLGGDDGIAVAYALAIMDDDSIAHPRLETVITSDEEIGLIGAAKMDTSMLTAKRLINLDSEEEGYLLVGCAGGQRVTNRIPVSYEEREGVIYNLQINGLLGGHSGIEINKERGNSHVLMGRLLHQISQELSFGLAGLAGGKQDNVIPKATDARVVVAQDDCIRFEQKVEELAAVICHEIESSEPDANVDCVRAGEGKVSVLTAADAKKVITHLVLIPNGVQKMSVDIEDLVDTSLNIGIVQLDEKEYAAKFSVRSSSETAKEYLSEKLKALTELLGGTTVYSGIYPGWEYKKNSPLRDVMVETFKELYGKDPVIQAIHAGLECGVFASKISNLDAISLGPDMFDVHSVNERLSIPSTQRTYEYLLRALEKMKA